MPGIPGSWQYETVLNFSHRMFYRLCRLEDEPMEHTYQVAGIDVHKSNAGGSDQRCGAGGGVSIPTAQVRSHRQGVACDARLVPRTGRARSGNGIGGAVLEAGLAGTGRRLRSISGAGVFQPGAARPQAGLRGRRAVAAASCGRRVDRQFRPTPNNGYGAP